MSQPGGNKKRTPKSGPKQGASYAHNRTRHTAAASGGASSSWSLTGGSAANAAPAQHKGPAPPIDQFIPGTASLVEELDCLLLVILRDRAELDGRYIYGTLRSFDQFANLVLEGTVERIFVDQEYGEKYRGLYVIRGENVVLLAAVDEDADKEHLATFTKIEWQDIVAKRDAKVATTAGGSEAVYAE